MHVYVHVTNKEGENTTDANANVTGSLKNLSSALKITFANATKFNSPDDFTAITTIYSKISVVANSFV